MAADILIKISADDKGGMVIKKLGAEVQRTKKRTAELGDVMQKTFAAVGVYKGIQLGINLMREATQETLEYEDALKRVQAISGASAKEVEALDKGMRSLALSSEHSAAELAKAANELAKAGVRGTEQMELMQHGMDLATVSGEDLAWSMKNTLNIMNVFGMGFTDVERIVNVVGNTLVNTQIDLENYMDSMRYAAPVAKSLGMTLEETSAMMGMMAQMGIRGSMAGTSLRNMLLNLLDVTPQTRKALADFNFEGKTLTEILGAFKEAGVPVKDLLDQFQKRALPAAIAMGENADAVKELEGALNDMSTPLSARADEIRTSLNNQLKITKDHFVEIALVMNDALGEDGKTLLQSFQGNLKDVAEWVEENEELVKQWGDTIASAAENILNVLTPAIKGVLPHAGTLATFFVAKNIAQFTVKIAGATTGIKGMGKALSQANVYASAFALGLEAINRIAGNIERAAIEKNMAAAWAVTNRFTEAHVKDLEKLSKLFEENAVSMGVFGDGTYYAVENISDALDAYNEKWLANFDITKDVEGTHRKIDALLASIREKVKAVGEETETTDESTQDFGDNLKRNVTELGESIEELESRMKHFQFGIQPGTMMEGFSGDRFSFLYDGLEMLDTPVDLDAFEDNVRTMEDIYAEGMDFIREETAYTSQDLQSTFSQMNGYMQQAATVFDIVWDGIQDANDRRHEREMENLREHAETVRDTHNKEKEAAGESALILSMIENKRERDMAKIQELQEERTREHLQKEHDANLIKILVDTQVAAISAAAQTTGGWEAKLGAAIGAEAVGLAAYAVAAADNPADSFRSGGYVEGVGNGTSDSVSARLSAGEYVVTADTVDKLGGRYGMERILEQNTTSNKNINISFGTIIGDADFVRERILPMIQREVSR